MSKRKRCHTCGMIYTGWACPRCHPRRRRRTSSSGRRSSGGGMSRRVGHIDWGRVLAPPAVNPDAVPDWEADNGT